MGIFGKKDEDEIKRLKEENHALKVQNMKDRDTSRRRNKWAFIHTYLKSMILNTMNTALHSSVVIDTPIITSKEHLRDDGIKEIYMCVHDGYDWWLKDFNHSVEMQTTIKRTINVGFTIANEDWVYSEAAKRVWVTMGRSYAKNILGIENPEELEKGKIEFKRHRTKEKKGSE